LPALPDFPIIIPNENSLVSPMLFPSQKQKAVHLSGGHSPGLPPSLPAGPLIGISKSDFFAPPDGRLRHFDSTVL